ncbi:DUF421 domain-containing protein [Fictibacillus aquaticus]|uniref:DUF421 domain-containing protein n=1 Tax=Fictibacillus aquaticus TaxID=2021314 RepID=A0A235FCC7_9BACL|nr:DUF421 domain-containing protein [Fictibacillus aquaticus]OYD59030.1 hypothetical protein CGZ90_03770 [Fictibacillus aquaticus]
MKALNFGSLTAELFFGFFALFVLTKALGKTEITQLTPFDFISSLILGELLGNAIYDTETNLWMIFYAVAVWGGLVYAIEILSQKFKGMRKLLEGSPAIVIRKGMIVREELKRNKIDINQLQNLIRQKGYFSLREIEYAILETNGTVSVMPKHLYSTPNRSDLKLQDQAAELPVTLIMDGEIIFDNLQTAGISKEQLLSKIKKHGIFHVEDVLYAEMLSGQLLVMPFKLKDIQNNN